MAKLFLYLNANDQSTDALLEACKDFCATSCVQTNSLDVALLKPKSNDILAVPPSSPLLSSIDLVLEIAAPAHVALSAIEPVLKTALEPILRCANLDSTHLICAYSKAFQETGKKPFRYHFVMFRRAEFNQADYKDYYINIHAQFGVGSPLADYYQNYVEAEASVTLADSLGVQAITADSVSELRFDDIEAYMFSDLVVKEVGPAATADAAIFVELAKCQSFSMDVLLDTRRYEG